jgi:hypothetical protein
MKVQSIGDRIPVLHLFFLSQAVQQKGNAASFQDSESFH